jgi:hypothetical protein
MKKVFFYLLLAVAFTACNNETATTEVSDENAVETTQEGLSVDNLLDNIDNMVGQEVTVFGTVDHVCKHGGGKMVIYTTDPENGIHIDATDESGKFRADELMDETVAVVGTVDEFVVDDGYIAEKEAKLEEMKAEQGDDVEEVEDEHEGEKVHKGNAPDNDGKHKKQIKGLENQIASLKEELATAKEEGKDHLSFYSVKCVSYKVVESDKKLEEEESNEAVGHQESAVENEAEVEDK